jgi:hypothetical protein
MLYRAKSCSNILVCFYFSSFSNVKVFFSALIPDDVNFQLNELKINGIKLIGINKLMGSKEEMEAALSVPGTGSTTAVTE